MRHVKSWINNRTSPVRLTVVRPFHNGRWLVSHSGAGESVANSPSAAVNANMLEYSRSIVFFMWSGCDEGDLDLRRSIGRTAI